MAITAKSIFNAIIEKVGSTYGKHVVYYVAGPHGDKESAMERLEEVAKTLNSKFSVKDVVFLGSNTKGAFDNKFKVDTATWKVASKGKEIEYNDYNVLLATPKLGLYLVEFGNDSVFGKYKLLFKDSEVEQSGDKSESRKPVKGESKTRVGRILESLKKRRKFNESAKTVESTRIKGYDSKKIKKNELGVNLDNLPSEVRFDFMWNPETERPAILARLNTEKFSGNDELKMVDMESNKTLATIKLEDAGMGLRTCTFNTEMHPKGTVDMFLTKGVMELINGSKAEGWYVLYDSMVFLNNNTRLDVESMCGYVETEKDAKKLLAAFKSRALVKGKPRDTDTGIGQVLDDLPTRDLNDSAIEKIKSGKVFYLYKMNGKGEAEFKDLKDFI